MARNVGVTVEGLTEFQKLLAGYEPKVLDKRMQKALLVGARTLVKPIRAEAPVSAHGSHGKPAGFLRKSVRARRGKRDKPSVVVGPTAPYRHLIIDGHRLVAHAATGAGRATTRAARAVLHASGGRTTPDPFVDRAVGRNLDKAIAAYTEALFGKDLK
jgi:hypothetical protein